jgi:transposase
VLSFTGSLRVLVAVEACDMRAGFNTLQGLVADKLKEDCKSGMLFVFSNRRHTRLKVLYWDGTGLWLLTKRLERGTFSWPRTAESGQVKLKLTPEAFALLTDGIDLHGAKPRGWYERE